MGTKIYKRRPDCAHYDACLTAAALNSKQLKCSGCRKYQYKPFRFDAFVYVNKENPIDYLPSLNCMDLEEIFVG
jgi:hypothetical protein